jgi:hypothetical protein
MVWHYTTVDRLVMIIAAGEIRPATTGVPNGEKPIVWFSTHPEWEPTATKAMKDRNGWTRRATIEEVEQFSGGLARIGVAPETAPHSWRELKHMSGMRSGEARRLERAAVEDRSFTGDWRGTFDSVPRERWLAVQVFRNGAWTDLDES